MLTYHAVEQVTVSKKHEARIRKKYQVGQELAHPHADNANANIR